MCLGQGVKNQYKKKLEINYSNLQTVAVARAAIPSSLPVKPNFSDVVAFKLIRFISRPLFLKPKTSSDLITGQFWVVRK